MLPKALVVSIAIVGCGRPPNLTGDAAASDATIDSRNIDSAIADALTPIDAPTPTDAPPDVPVDAPPDPNPPVVTQIATVDGFTEIRQSGIETIVITGMDLDAVTSISLAVGSAQIVSTSLHEVRATIGISAGAALGPFSLTVTAFGGTTTVSNALTVTPIVVATGVTSGHGTYQSPFDLCAIAPLGVTESGDTVQLLAGAHVCGDYLSLAAGITLEGASSATTSISGLSSSSPLYVSFAGVNPPTTTVRDLAILQPTTQVDTEEGAFIMERVTIEAPVVAEYLTTDVTLTDVTAAGSAAGFSIGMDGHLRITNVTVHDCTRALRIDGADGTTAHLVDIAIDGLVIQRCTLGLSVGTVPKNSSHYAQGIMLSARGVQILDSGTGIQFSDGQAQLYDIVIHGGVLGLDLLNGYVFVVGGEISGLDPTATAVHAHSETTGDLPDPFVIVSIDHALLDGSRIGVDWTGWDDASSLAITNSTLGNHSTAALVCEPLDQGRISVLSSMLSVTSGYAIDDQRVAPSLLGAEITATGTTLNGTSFTGQTIMGPATVAPYFRIASKDATIAF